MSDSTKERVCSPADVLSWGVALHPDCLSPGEVLVSATWTINATDTSYGVKCEAQGIEADADFGAVASAIIWIDSTQQGNSRWDGTVGTVITPTCLVETSHGERYQVELRIRVARSKPPNAAIAQRLLVIGDPRP